MVNQSFTYFLQVNIRYRGTISNEIDNFRIEFLIGLATILSLVINHQFAIFEILWTFSSKLIEFIIWTIIILFYFSVYLESVAILPQLTVTNQGKASEADGVIIFYLSALTSHKIFYILNWLYRYSSEGFYDSISMGAGIIQAAIYLNFFVMFFIKKLAESKLESSV